MSLSSFLLKSTSHVDSELDSLFKTQPAVAPISSTDLSDSGVLSKKRKLKEPTRAASQKRQKISPKQETRTKSKSKAQSEELPLVEEEDGLSLQPNEVNEESEKSEDEKALVHEAIVGKLKTKSKGKEKYVPVDEKPGQRDERTIFVGNLALDIAQKRPLQKQLQRHILSFVPTAKIESIRFRSVPFNSPSSTATDTTNHPHKNPSQLEHDRARASSWRSPADKAYLTPNQKKKYLFLTHQFHSSAATIHAYIVFAHPPPPSHAPRPSNLPPLPSILDPYEAAKQAVKNANGTEFEGRVLRVDFVGGLKYKGETIKKGEVGVVVGTEGRAFKDADPKSTLFIGNLDLGAQEEDLRAFFESLMKTERGEPSSSTNADDGDGGERKARSWVTRVRIIRDKDTQLGKGFAYVQFIDRECIDEILALEPTQLKFAKRKLRVQRCKTLPGTKLSSSIKSSLAVPTSTTDSSKSKAKQAAAIKHQKAGPALRTAITIPKGDPGLGIKLSTMSKEERKAAKAADADRVARRLAKKKARMVMGTSRDRAISTSGGQEKKKVRERVRSGTSGKKRAGDGKSKEGKKTRLRSEKSIQKRNVKK